MKLLRSYLFWTYERGSIHYDVMVSLILVFLFVSPRFIDYGDKPVQTVPLRDSEVLVKEAGSNGLKHQFIYEPSPEEVLGYVLPRLVDVQIYQALQESLASEHSSRRMAMKSATDNASDMIDDLTLTYNSVRQGTITREIAEITSGAAALSLFSRAGWTSACSAYQMVRCGSESVAPAPKSSRWCATHPSSSSTTTP